MIEELKKSFPRRWKKLIVVALAIFPDGEIDGYDGLDKQMKKEDIDIFSNIIGIS